MKQLRTALSLLLLMTGLLGLAYPSAVWMAGVLFFPHQAKGSLVVYNGKTIGSEIIGQHFTSPKYFWSRPSATTGGAYQFMGSGASNLSLRSEALKDSIQQTFRKMQCVDELGPVPIDLVTSSGSGLDPDISPESAIYQVPRVAQARGLDTQTLLTLIQNHTEKPQLHILGKQRVNVLLLNMALDAMDRGQK